MFMQWYECYFIIFTFITSTHRWHHSCPADRINLCKLNFLCSFWMLPVGVFNKSIQRCSQPELPPTSTSRGTSQETQAEWEGIQVLPTQTLPPPTRPSNTSTRTPLDRENKWSRGGTPIADTSKDPSMTKPSQGHQHAINPSQPAASAIFSRRNF